MPTSLVVETIWNQLDKGVLMSLGARQFVHSEFTLHFTVGQGTKNKVVITYEDGRDLYTLSRTRGFEILKKHERVHVSQLNELLLSFDRSY